MRSRSPSGDPETPGIVRDPDRLASHLTDAAHVPGGRAAGLAAPATEYGVAAILRTSPRVLPIGAQSSLTGGATPMGDVLLSTARLSRIEHVGSGEVRVQAGVPLAVLDQALAAAGCWYPPAPTFLGATVGGTIATNAAGPATFKYGTTRRWVRSLTVVLPDGDVLDIARGDHRAHAGGYFELQLRDRTARVPVPTYRMPAVAKLSAGYFAEPGMDLVDLFIGAEGTLGVVTAATLAVLTERPARCTAFVPFGRRADGLAFAERLRNDAMDARRTTDPRAVDVSAIEHMDARCLALLREDGLDRVNGVSIPPTAALALLITIELPASTTGGEAFAQIENALDPDGAGTPLGRFCRYLDDAGVLDDVTIAVPGDAQRTAQLLALREGVPAAVNARVGRAQRQIDGRIQKTAADLLVPFERMAELLDACDDEFGRRGLDSATWGHLSDGNVHPNVIPRSRADVEAGQETVLALGRVATRLGGTPLAEHGVGRNLVKQRLLRELYGDAGIEEMRRVKRALDPSWKLASGVIFTPDGVSFTPGGVPFTPDA